MPKIIPHKKLFLICFLVCFSWLSFAQAIIIVTDGRGNSTGICPDGQVKISTSDPSLRRYQWQQLLVSGWSAVPFANNDNLNVSYKDANKYRLLATDNLGNDRTSNELDLIQLSPPPTPVINPSRNINQICQGDSLILKTTITSGFNLFWSLDDVQLSIPQTAQITAKKAGKYDVVLIDQTNGCTAKSAIFKLDYTSTITVKLNSVNPFCKLTDTPINLSATPAGGRFKGKGITDANNGTFSPTVAGVGKHEITYEVPLNGSCPSLSDIDTILVSDLKPIITTNTGKTQFCEGDIATLSVLPNMKDYAWYSVGNPTPIGSLSKLDIGLAGKFNVAVVEKETLCQVTSPDINIEFFAPSSVTMDQIPSVCGTEYPVVPLKGTPLGGAFTIDGVFATTFDYKKLGFGKHKVTYTLNGDLPCLRGSTGQEVDIQDSPRPDLGPDILLGKGNSTTLRGTVNGGVSYLWTPATDLDNPSAANPVARPDKTTEYIVKVLSSNGCLGEGKVNVVVYQPVLIPTAFSPNADGTNDLWELKGLDVYPNPEVQIFDRWGNMVFYSKGNYTPFDGTDSTKTLPEGMYVYKINPFPDRPDFQYKGTFMLFR